jgi:hypothetical protein
VPAHHENLVLSLLLLRTTMTVAASRGGFVFPEPSCLPLITMMTTIPFLLWIFYEPVDARQHSTSQQEIERDRS